MPSRRLASARASPRARGPRRGRGGSWARRQKREKARLAGAVRPDQSDPLPGMHCQVRVLEQAVRAAGEGYVRESDQVVRLAVRPSEGLPADACRPLDDRLGCEPYSPKGSSLAARSSTRDIMSPGVRAALEACAAARPLAKVGVVSARLQPSAGRGATTYRTLWMEVDVNDQGTMRAAQGGQATAAIPGVIGELEDAAAILSIVVLDAIARSGSRPRNPIPG